MDIKIGANINDDNRINFFIDSTIQKTKRKKGKSLLLFPENFTVIDLETTGLNTRYDDIIELAAIKVKNNKIIDTYQSFINPGYTIPEFITELTGITTDMVKDAPRINEALEPFLDYIGSDIIIGHNVNFDINFLYDNSLSLGLKDVDNDFIDTLRLCRYLYIDMKHHRLSDMVERLNIKSDTMHRSLADCYSCLNVFYCCRKESVKQFGSESNFTESINKKRYKYKSINIDSIQPEKDNFDIAHPLYQKVCVFTGALDKMKRADAMQLVVNLGGVLGKSVTKSTNYLILGNNDFCKTIKDGKSSKQKKAEELKLKGQDIEIISEQTFYDMLEM